MRGMRRVLRMVGTGLVIAIAFAAFAASAQAIEWSYEGKVLKEGEIKELPCSLEGSSQLETHVSGQLVKLNFTGVKCIGWKIQNKSGQAISNGKLEFTGVTVLSPANCSGLSSLTTKSISGLALEEPKLGTGFGVRYVPEAGEETGWMTFELTGASCPIKTTIIPKGSDVAEVFAEETMVQPYKFNSTVQSLTGSTLHVGTETAVLTGIVNFTFG